MTAVVLRGDARALPLPDDSVDLIVTSPPYWQARSYTDDGEHYDGQIGAEPTPGEYIDALLDCTREAMRVLKPSGSLFVVLADRYSNKNNPPWRGSSDGYTRRQSKLRRIGTTDAAPRKSLLGLPWLYATACVYELGLTLRRDIIWSKANGVPESVLDRCQSSHEYLFHLTLQSRYYSQLDEIRERPAQMRSSMPGGGGTYRTIRAAGARDTNLATATTHPLGRIPGSVWKIANDPLMLPVELDVEHYAAYPPALVRPLIAGWSPSAAIVLDPFGGTGTTALVASVLGRTGISIDLSADYCRAARWRTTDPAQRARALQVTPPPAVIDGQGELFEVVQ